MNLRDRIQDGLSGKYKGLENGFTRLNNYIFGIQRKCYTLLGGASGVYKTTLVDFILSNGLADAEQKNIPIEIFYYSFEIDELTKKCNWTSKAVYDKYKIIIPPEKIKGFGNNRLTEYEQGKVDSVIDDVEDMMSKINFYYDGVNPTGIYKDIISYCDKHGTIHYEEYKDNNGIKQKRIQSYTPNDDRYIIIALDHLALTPMENQLLMKANIDKLSSYFIKLRNIFGCTIFAVSQFNDGLSTVERQKHKGIDLSPQQTDFKDSRSPYADADVVLGLMNPWKLDMDTCLGFDLNHHRDKFIMLKIIKNRLSKDNIALALLAHPQSGSFEEL